MIGKIAKAVLVITLLGSCHTPKYLPSSANVDIGTHGAYIKIVLKTEPNIYGELIAIDKNNMVVLDEEKTKCVTVPIREVKRISLRYAAPKHYGWLIPTGILLPAIHGLLSIYTIPIHLIATTWVTISAENAFRYSNKNKSYDQLRMFARFPQGIPENINIAEIR